MNRTTLLALAALAFVPVSAQAQSVSAHSTTQANAAVATPDARIAAAMQAAVEADIPQSLLESKVREARAKQATPEQTAAAVEARLAALLEVRRTLPNTTFDLRGNAASQLGADLFAPASIAGSVTAGVTAGVTGIIRR